MMTHRDKGDARDTKGGGRSEFGIGGTDISLAFIHYEALCSDFFIPLIPFIPVSPKLSLSA
jgi:hypothetical protein